MIMIRIMIRIIIRIMIDARNRRKWVMMGISSTSRTGNSRKMGR